MGPSIIIVHSICKSLLLSFLLWCLFPVCSRWPHIKCLQDQARPSNCLVRGGIRRILHRRFKQEQERTCDETRSYCTMIKPCSEYCSKLVKQKIWSTWWPLTLLYEHHPCSVQPHTENKHTAQDPLLGHPFPDFRCIFWPGKPLWNTFWS